MTDQEPLPFVWGATSERSLRVEQWLHLTNTILPALATQHSWPVSQNHCFMRICLDTSIGEPWHRRVQHPALRHLTDQQLHQAIAVAMQIVDTPSLLPELNTRSIAQRKKFAAADQRNGSLQKRMMSI